MHYKKDDAVFKKEFREKRYLFQGNSCFPLSPCSDNKTKQEDKQAVHIISKTDQVKVILKELGTQTEEQLSFLTSEHALTYIRELEESNTKRNSAENGQNRLKIVSK